MTPEQATALQKLKDAKELLEKAQDCIDMAGQFYDPSNYSFWNQHATAKIDIAIRAVDNYIERIPKE